MELIRPLYLVREDDIKAWRDYNNLHFIQCACKFTDTCTTCNNEENRSKRVEIKELIRRLKEVNPYRGEQYLQERGKCQLKHRDRL